MSIIFYVALAMLAGLMMTRLTKLVNLPNVTAYLMAGVLIGPYALNLIGLESLNSMIIMTDIALGFIAFSIGDELKFSTLKKIGKPVLIITVCEALGAVILVMVSTRLFGVDPVISLVLGALSASTAPAATLLVVRQYKAEGPLTNMLLPVVASDDAIGLILYSVCVSIAMSILKGEGLNVSTAFLKPLAEIIISLLAGAGLGILLSLTHRFFKSKGNRMSFCIAFVMSGVALAERFELSSLLLCMSLGIAYTNLSTESQGVFSTIDDWTYPLFMLFFVISGANFNLAILPQVGALGLIYIVMRFVGKFVGAWIGGTITKQPPVIKNNLGWALMPQAGVAIGMATMALAQLPREYGEQIQTVILGATLIYEILGPIVTKNTLKRAGEIQA